MHRLGAAALTALACALVIAVTGPPGAAAQREQQGGARILGDVLGGVTSQGFPVVLEVSNPVQATRIGLVSVAIRLNCADGVVTLPDGYTNVPVSKRGQFKVSFGPETVRNDDGTTLDGQGRLQGTFNRSRNKASGIWQLKVTVHDTAGAVTDTCDSGRVTWRVKQ